ncbi:MAG: hypothetical protein RL308_3165 [Bacteroidota bacterium]|jgi:beta-lactamase superfamily II metal-dependent hydrolase
MVYLPANVRESYFDDGKVVVFIERLQKTSFDNSISKYTLVFDFLIDSRSKNNFIARTNLIFADKSMMEISELTFDKFGLPREGSFYILPEELIVDFEWISVANAEEFGANYLAFRASFNKNSCYFKNAENYQNFVTSVDFGNDYLLENVVKPIFNSIKPKNLKISVYNVGQGNWNEINFNDETLLVYDFGSSSSQILANLINQNVIPQVRQARIDKIDGSGVLKKILIISHWDTDHYIGIKALSDIQLQSIDLCIIPNLIENETTRNVLMKLVDNTKVIPIEMNSIIPGGAKSRLTIEYDSPLLKLYKGTKCRDRNKRGIILSLHYKNKDFVFPGDHYYNQIDMYIKPLCKGNEYNLVIPHHGGNAGNYLLLDQVNNGNNGIISTGGRYCHPIIKIETKISANFRNTHRTDKKGDYKISIL